MSDIKYKKGDWVKLIDVYAEDIDKGFSYGDILEVTSDIGKFEFRCKDNRLWLNSQVELYAEIKKENPAKEEKPKDKISLRFKLTVQGFSFDLTHQEVNNIKLALESIK